VSDMSTQNSNIIKYF